MIVMLSKYPDILEAPRVQILMWIFHATLEDLDKAHTYAEANGYVVTVCPDSCKDVRGAALASLGASLTPSARTWLDTKIGIIPGAMRTTRCPRCQEYVTGLSTLPFHHACLDRVHASDPTHDPLGRGRMYAKINNAMLDSMERANAPL